MLSYGRVQAQAALELMAAGQPSIAGLYLARLDASLESAERDLSRLAAELHTVKYHVEQITARLHAETRSEALAAARRAGLIEK